MPKIVNYCNIWCIILRRRCAFIKRHAKLKLTPHLTNDMMKMYSDAMVIEVGPHKVINDGRQDDAFLAILTNVLHVDMQTKAILNVNRREVLQLWMFWSPLEGLGIGFAMHKGYQCQIDRLLRYYFANFRHTQKYE